MFDYVRNYYGVPAEKGKRITHQGRPGIIVEDRGHYIGVTFDDEKPGMIHNVHPTDNVVYGEKGTIRKVSKSKQRYLAYLDSESGETFFEWLTNPYWNDYRKRHGCA